MYFNYLKTTLFYLNRSKTIDYLIDCLIYHFSFKFEGLIIEYLCPRNLFSFFIKFKSIFVKSNFQVCFANQLRPL